jgi:hypothetical protein
MSEDGPPEGGTPNVDQVDSVDCVDRTSPGGGGRGTPPSLTLPCLAGPR